MTAWEAIRQAPARLPRLERPRLRLLNRPPKRMGTVPFYVMVLALLVAGLVGLLALSIHVQDQAFALKSRQQQAQELSSRVSDLETQLNEARSPKNLASRAAELGMIPNASAAYIDLRSGKILGEPRPAYANEIPGLKVPPTSLLVMPGEQEVKSMILPWLTLPNEPDEGGR